MSPSDTPDPDPSRAVAQACPYEWCTTPHGATSHPDDEDHRSDGILVPIVARGRERGAPPTKTEVEMGLLRRTLDDETWFVIDDGNSVHLEVPVESARRLIRAVLGDESLRAELGIRPE